MNTDTTILLVAHGSRGRDGNQESINFATQWRQRHPDWRIEVCFIEHADVLLAEGLDRAAKAARTVVAIPLILNAAGHVKMELPAAVEAARARHPAVNFVITRHLGMGREIFAVLQAQLDRQMKQLAVPDPQTTGVVLLGRGSSDLGANGELAKMARWLYEENEHELVDLAFTGVTWPRLETVVQRQARLGMMQIAIIPVYLFTGVLIERIGEQVARLRQQYPRIAFGLGGHFGFDDGVFRLLDARVATDALDGDMLECDGCKYRELAEGEHLHDHSHTAIGCAQHGHDHAHAHEHHGCAHSHA
nr:sirohydrochlorin chelatase [Dechloromonas sp.]